MIIFESLLTTLFWAAGAVAKNGTRLKTNYHNTKPSFKKLSLYNALTHFVMCEPEIWTS